MQEDPGFARAALHAGATGYLLKDAADEELLAAVHLAAAGRRHLAPALRAALTQGAAPERVDRGLSRLTAREREVLTLIGDGHTSAEIAAALGVSVRTVESHRAHIHQKVTAPTRADLVAYARRLG